MEYIIEKEGHYIAPVKENHIMLKKVLKNILKIKNNMNSQKNLNIIREFCLGLLKLYKEQIKLSMNSIRHINEF